jgi:hypothetical protein
MEVLQGDTCQGRLHWGKAGRRGKHDGGEEGESDAAYGGAVRVDSPSPAAEGRLVPRWFQPLHL